jgi:hypothetical protein
MSALLRTQEIHETFDTSTARRLFGQARRLVGGGRPPYNWFY